MAIANGMMPLSLRWTKSVNIIFAVKHDGRHKARLVAGGHLTPDPIESIYSGVVSIRSLRLVIFLADTIPTRNGSELMEIWW